MNVKLEMQLLRLKEVLGVTREGDIAAALGMSHGAFSQRKNAGSIPEDRLLALRRTRPDFDVIYVLTGVRWAASAKTGGADLVDIGIALGNDEVARSGLRAAKRFEEEIKAAADDLQVRELLALLIWCSREHIRDVKRLAAQLVGDRPLPFSEREPPNEFMIGRMPEPPSVAAPMADESEPAPTPKAKRSKRTKSLASK